MFNIVYPFYNNYLAFDAIKEKLSQLPCNITIVDDGSSPKFETNIPNIKVLRIEQDKPWNQPVASNLGIKSLNKNDIVLRMDIDHYIEPSDFPLFKKISENISPKTFLRFSRYEIRSKSFINSAPNISMFLCEDFLNVGCYDESFAGNYGYEDLEFFARAKFKGYNVLNHELGIIYVDKSFGTRNLNRDISKNKEKYNKIINKYK